MRSLVLVMPLVLFACAKSDKTATDTAGATAAAAAPAAPRPLAAADVMGNWQGQTMAQDKDTVLRKWTSVRATDSTGKLALAGAKDSIPYRVQYDADSMIITSQPYTSPGTPRGPKLVFRSIGRLKDGKLIGTVTTMLAAKRDSIVEHARWEATRAQ
jgi:hypothetical protein